MFQLRSKGEIGFHLSKGPCGDGRGGKRNGTFEEMKAHRVAGA